jgi:hypothetical protein
MKHPAPKKLPHPARDSAAEKRLQSLLHELDKFDDVENEDGGDAADGYDYTGPARRWSDDTPDDA